MLKTGFLLFLVTEVMFFAGSFEPSFMAVYRLQVESRRMTCGRHKNSRSSRIPLLNTGILICSGLSFEIAVRGLKKGIRKLVEEALIMTLVLALFSWVCKFMNILIYYFLFLMVYMELLSLC